MRKLYLLSTLVLTLLFCRNSYAQDFSNKGKDFWVGYGYHQIMTGTNVQEMVLYFATDQVTNITISIPGTGYTQTLTSPAGNSVLTSAAIPKAGGMDARLNVEGLSNKGIHITSDKPMVAYAHVYNNSVSGATILFPTNTLGKEYYSVNYKNTSNTNGANCFFYVIAADPGVTTVEITPTGNTLGGWIAGNTYTITLNQGEVYNVMGVLTTSTNPFNGVDLTGSKIRSVAAASGGCKKIAVYSGSGRISISCTAGSSSSDNYMVQSFPSSAWGKKFLTAPATGNQSFNIFRVCVSDPTAVVSINGAVTGLPLQANFYYEIAQTNQPLLIEADKPITVAQYFSSQGSCGNGNPGDPEVIYLSPVEQNINKVLWNATPNFAILNHSFNAIIPNTGTGVSSFRLRDAVGTILPIGAFITHPQDANFSYLRQTLPGAGIYSIESDSGFNAIAYGFGSAESYGYNAGTNIKDIFQYVTVQNQYATVNFPATCRNTPFYFSMTFPYQPTSIYWDFFGLVPTVFPSNFNMPDPSLYFTGTIVVGTKTLYQYRIPTPYSIPTAGTYPIRVTATNPTPDGCGGTQEIDYDLQVFNNPIADFNFNDVCFPDPVQFLDNSFTDGRPVISRYWDFGDVTTGNTNNPLHSYAAPGTYNVRYSLITDIGCTADTIMHPVTVSPLPDAAIAANAATVCLNGTEPTITFTGSVGTAPYTFTYTINGAPQPTVVSVGNTATVNVPTTTAGTFTYAVTNVSDASPAICTQPITGVETIVTVNALPTAAISGTIAVCQNAAPPVVTFTGAVGTAPYTFNYTINGTPQPPLVSVGSTATVTAPTGVPGTYIYALTNVQEGSALACSQNQTSSITITIDPDAAISLTGGTNTQTVCINAPISQIEYLITGGGSGATVSGLPAGVTGSFSGSQFTIIGSPTVAGTFNYTVNTTGTCLQTSATGTITVTPDATLVLNSAAATTTQTVCVNHAITDIVYQWGASATDATITGLPAGVTATPGAGGVVTISGTPTVFGTFPYSIQTVGPCVNPTLTGTITVTDESIISLTTAPATENQELCINSLLTDIKYSVSGSATNITVAGLPAGVTGTFAGGVLTIQGTPTVSGTFNYTVTPVGPCVETGDGGTIIVNPLPTPDFSVTTPSCETKVLTFTDLSTPNVGAVNAWTWNFGDASPPSNLQNPTHTYAAAGSYNVTLSVTNDKGCVSNPTLTRSVTVNPQPVTDAILPEVCLDDTFAQFFDNSSIASGSIVGWLWNFGDPGSGPLNTSTLEDPQHSYSAVGNYTITLTTTSNNGCQTTNTFPFVVNGDIPVADFTALNPATMCANDSISIQDASTVNFGSVTKVEIYWDYTGPLSPFDTDDTPTPGKIYKHKYPNFQIPLTRTFTIRYVAYSGATCLNVRTRTITVNAAPLVQFNNMPDACLDALPFQITQATEIGGVPGTGVFSGPGVNSTGTFNPASVGPGTYLIKYTFTSTAGGCVDTLSKPITVLDSASAQFTFSALKCENSPVSFNSTSSTIPAASGTITGWTWDFGDPGSGANNTSSLQNPTHSFTGWGTFNVRLFVTTSNGCRSTLRTIPVFVNPVPRPDFSMPASSCLPSATVVFNSSASSIPDGTEGSFTYLWNFDDPASGALNTSTNSSPSHIYNTAGPFNVSLQITSGAGCVNTIIKPLTTIHPQPTGDFTVDKTDVCVGAGTFTFTDNSDPKDGTTVQWNWNMDDGNIRTTPVVLNYNFSTPRTYNVSLYTVNSHGCRSTTFTLPVTVHPYPVVDAGPDRIMLEGGQIVLEPTVTGNDLTYLWTPVLTGYFAGSNAVKNPSVNGIDDITLTLTVTGRGGCVDDDQMFIKVLKFPSIPNIFSPNGDGVHDKWVISYLDTYPGSTVDIYNRYGQLIFHSDGYTVPWDGTVNGKPVPVGTYYYIVNPKNGRKLMSGYVDVIR